VDHSYIRPHITPSFFGSDAGGSKNSTEVHGDPKGSVAKENGMQTEGNAVLAEKLTTDTIASSEKAKD
jgi:hypothetical protein